MKMKNKFIDYLSSQITPQLTLLEKLNKIIEFLKTNPNVNLFSTKDNYTNSVQVYYANNINTRGAEMQSGDVLIFSNGYFGIIDSVGSDNVTVIDGIKMPTGPQGETGATGSVGPQGPRGNGIIETEAIDSRESNGYTINTIKATLDNGEDVIFTVTVKNGERGIQGEIGPQGTQGATGVQGPQGVQGPIGITGPQGPAGPTGPQGPQGLAGEDGRSFQITTVVANEAELPQAGAVYIGKAYGVGSEENYEVYICVEENGVIKWTNWGKIQGPQGPRGEQGPSGVQGPQGEQGIQGIQGIQGPEGIQGKTGAQGPAGASIKEIKNTGDRQSGGYTISTLQPVDTNDKNLPTVEVRTKSGETKQFMMLYGVSTRTNIADVSGAYFSIRFAAVVPVDISATHLANMIKYQAVFEFENLSTLSALFTGGKMTTVSVANLDADTPVATINGLVYYSTISSNGATNKPFNVNSARMTLTKIML